MVIQVGNSRGGVDVITWNGPRTQQNIAHAFVLTTTTCPYPLLLVHGAVRLSLSIFLLYQGNSLLVCTISYDLIGDGTH